MSSMAKQAVADMDPHIRKEVSLDAKGEFFSALVHE